MGGQQSNTEVDDIWHENGKYRRALQSQQLQMATEKTSLVGITAENEVCSLKNTNFSCLAMQLSMEDMILSQLDLIWENYIVSAYNSYYSDDLWPLSDVSNFSNCIFISRESSDIAQTASRPHILYEHSRDPCKTSVGHIGFNSICYEIFTAQNQRQVTEKIWNSYVGAIKMKNLWRKRKPSAQKRAKRSLKINECGYLPPYLMELNEKTKTDFIPYTIVETKDEDSLVRPCEIEAYLEKNASMLRRAQETCCNVKPGSKMSDDGCYSGSVLKSLVISSSSLGVTEEVFSSTFIPQTDSSVDYSEQCGSQLQKGRCKVPAESDESLCLTNNSDSNINLHVRLSVHPCILTSDVILSDVNCTEPGERQGQNRFNRAACERRRIQDAVNALKNSPKNKSSLPCIDKRNRHCGSKDKSFLPIEKAFSIQLNYPQRLEKQHFLQNINVSILAASLLAVSKKDFSFFQSTGLQSTSQTESSHEMSDESFSLKQEGLKYEQAEVEVSLGTENVNNSTGRAHLDYKTALNKPDFCLPSCFQNGVDTEQSEKGTSGNSVAFFIGSTCLNQVSYTERFEKICLEKCLVESESSNVKETYCSFRNEILFYKSRSRQDNLNTIEYEPSKHQSCTKDATEDKESMEEVLSGNHHNIGDSSINEKAVEDVEEVDMTFSISDCMDEENQHVNLYNLDELLNRSPVSSMCVETAINENSKQECDPINEIKIEELLVVTKEHTDASSEGSKVLLENTDFEMKAQFDLVLGELKMFHMIEEEKVENFKTEQGNRLEHTCNNAKKLQDGVKKTFPSNKMIVGSDSEDLVTKKDYIYDRKTTSEQGVPQQYMSSCLRDEESLYSAGNIAVAFSHGIGRVTPLKTRTGPLRIGLSKKAKIKQLHPYLR